jgi:hypothetical protein
MLLGVCFASLQHEALAQRGDNLADAVRELGLETCRIPLNWCKLDPLGEGRLNPDAVTEVQATLDALPPNTKPLAFILRPSFEVAVDYFEDQSTMADRFSAFCEALARQFPSIEEWEIWNEPNASDFYLSICEGNTARPWTAAEFIDHVLLPGGKAIRRVLPESRICIAPMAEDGLEGHDDKPPALANRIPKTEKYEKYRADHPYGHFFFIPGFWHEMAAELAGRREEILPIFDACAFHPYPYFKIHQRENGDLFPATKHFTENFLAVYKEHCLDDLEIWVTEVGARSLVVKGFHYNDEQQQKEFAEDILEYFNDIPSITRLYWYHLVDIEWDLRQEKTFGLLDHHGHARPVFFTMKQKVLEWSRNPVKTYLLDDMQYARCMRGSGLDPAIWSSRANTIFGHTLGSMADDGRGELLVVPGRKPGDNVRLKSAVPLAVPENHALAYSIKFASTLECNPFALELLVMQDEKRAGRVKLQIDDNHEVCVDPEEGGDNWRVNPDVCSCMKIEHLQSVTAEWKGDSLTVTLLFDEKRISHSFCVEPLPADLPLTTELVFSRVGVDPVFIPVNRYEARVSDKY